MVEISLYFQYSQRFFFLKYIFYDLSLTESGRNIFRIIKMSSDVWRFDSTSSLSSLLEIWLRYHLISTNFWRHLCKNLIIFMKSIEYYRGSSLIAFSVKFLLYKRLQHCFLILYQKSRSKLKRANDIVTSNAKAWTTSWTLLILNQRTYSNVIGHCSLQHAKGDWHRLCASRFY